MWQSLQSFIDALFVGPVWPASVLLLLVLGYLLLSLVTTFGLESAEVDLDAHGWQGLGASTLSWLHLDTIPIAVWGGLFACFNWLLAYILWNVIDAAAHEPTLLTSSILATRNAVIAAVLTKVVTAPLASYFGNAARYDEQTLVGRCCVVASGEATPTFGQAKFDTGGAPLLLNIRTDGLHLTKGTVVRIVAFDADRRTYLVTLDLDSSCET